MIDWVAFIIVFILAQLLWAVGYKLLHWALGLYFKHQIQKHYQEAHHE